ncbi:MAG TPA: NAD(P)/FAD-dependent oxidoreductase [Stellaceae bacterium]|nr:NAD(P)/FAD-dependent oxidoreductase [Stellaceae bacterium]
MAVTFRSTFSRAPTRRGFAAGALAAAALRGAARAALPASAASLPGHPVDVAIIGAGAAGIAAARACQNLVDYVVLEARGRVGGRCTTSSSFVIPVDLGAQWFQMVTPNAAGTGTNNPLFDIAAALSLSDARVNRLLRLQPDLFDRAFYRNRQKLPLTNPETLAAAALLLEMDDAVAKAGEAINSGTLADLSFQQLLENEGFLNQPWGHLDAGATAASFGVTIDKLGVLDIANLYSLGPTPELPSPFNWLTPYGLGNFLRDFLAAGLAISLNTKVLSINRGAGGVTIATSRGTVTAKTAIITIPPSVLISADGPAFTPPLPSQYQDAFAGLPMGVVEKIVMQFDTPNVFPGLEARTSLNTFSTLFRDSLSARVVYAREWDSNVGVCFAAGPEAQAAAEKGKRALLALGLETMKAIFGGDPASHLVKWDAPSWWTDPFAHGSYSYAPPGNVPLRTVLTQPVDDQLYFAGEAASLLQRSSLPGAWVTGEKAAIAAIKQVEAARTTKVSVA